MLHRLKLLILQLTLLCISSLAFSANSHIWISGWIIPEIDQSKPEPWIGSDPVFGRLVCPPLSRFNLKENKSEPLIFDNIEELNTNQIHQWKFHLRNGIYWWNGEEVNTLDISEFFESHLKSIVNQFSAKVWNTPHFKIINSTEEIRIEWSQKPKFSPYVINDYPFWRKKRNSVVNSFQYECAGIYSAEFKNKNQINLVPQKKYHLSNPPAFLVLNNKMDSKIPSGEIQLNFTNASHYESDPETRHPREPIPCQNEVEMPIMSAINWNPKSYFMKNAELRKIATNLIPRGNLVRSAGGYLGSLVSSHIPKSHPGYNSQIKVRSYDIELATKKLDSLGFKRKSSKELRHDKIGKLLKLRIGIDSSTDSILKKVIADSFFFIGIDIEFVENYNNIELLDGVLTALYLPWPNLNFLPNYHSKSSTLHDMYHFYDAQFDKQLEAYALTLTTEAPQLNKLKGIHSWLYEHEPSSIILQHSVCLETSGLKTPKKFEVDVKDPDWFRKIVLTF